MNVKKYFYLILGILSIGFEFLFSIYLYFESNISLYNFIIIILFLSIGFKFLSSYKYLDDLDEEIKMKNEM